MTEIQDTGIIGGGFTAYCLAQRYKNAIIITCNKPPTNSHLLLRRQLQVNKQLNRYAPSAGHVRYRLPPHQLHDRLGLGGNSEIWGGFLDISHPGTTSLLQTLPDITLREFVPQDAIYSPNGRLCLMLDSHRRVFSAADYFRRKGFIDGYACLLEPHTDYITVHTLCATGERKQWHFRRVLLACGVVQTLDMLAMSGFLKQGDKIRLSDNRYALRRYTQENVSDEEYQIHFRFLAAAGKFLGFKHDIFQNVQRLGPFCVTQHFGHALLTLTLEYAEREGMHHFIHLPESSSPTFGRSIHYGNMQVNNLPLTSFISDISTAISVYGTASLTSIAPGPVSQQILWQSFTQ